MIGLHSRMNSGVEVKDVVSDNRVTADVLNRTTNSLLTRSSSLQTGAFPGVTFSSSWEIAQRYATVCLVF